MAGCIRCIDDQLVRRVVGEGLREGSPSGPDRQPVAGDRQPACDQGEVGHLVANRVAAVLERAEVDAGCACLPPLHLVQRAGDLVQAARVAIERVGGRRGLDDARDVPKDGLERHGAAVVALDVQLHGMRQHLKRRRLRRQRGGKGKLADDRIGCRVAAALQRRLQKHVEREDHHDSDEAGALSVLDEVQARHALLHWAFGPDNLRFGFRVAGLCVARRRRGGLRLAFLLGGGLGHLR